MVGAGFGGIADAVAGGLEAGAEVDILEPDGPEAFIHAGELVENRLLYQEKRTGGLFDVLWESRIKISAAVVAIDGVGWEKAIDAENFEDEGERCGKAAGGKAGLPGAGEIEEAARGGATGGGFKES